MMSLTLPVLMHCALITIIPCGPRTVLKVFARHKVRADVAEDGLVVEAGAPPQSSAWQWLMIVKSVICVSDATAGKRYCERLTVAWQQLPNLRQFSGSSEGCLMNTASPD